ncbi:hypothetical protein ACTFIW_002223 [Dictyostelium discoideum]
MYNIENNSILIDNETFSYKKTIRDNSVYRSIIIGIIIFLLNNLVKNFSNSEIVLGLSPKFKILLFIISLISSLFVTILISKTCKKISLIIPSIFLYFLFLTNCYIQFRQDNGNANITGELNQNSDSSTISGSDSGSDSDSDGSDSNGQFNNDINKQILVTVISIVSLIMSPFFIQYFWVSTMEFIIKISNQSNIGLHFGIILGLPDFLDSLFSFLVKHFTLNNYYEFGLIFIIPIIILILLLGKTSITCNKFDKICFDSNNFFDGKQIQYQQYHNQQQQHHHNQQQQHDNIQIQNNESIPLPTSIQVKSNPIISIIKLMKKKEFIHMVPVILLYGFIGNWLNYELFDEIILGYKATTQFIIISHLISSCLCFTIFGYFSDKFKRTLILISVLLVGIIGSVINVLVIYYEIELFEKNTSLYFSSLLFIQMIYYLIGIQIYSHISHLFEDKFNSLYSSSSGAGAGAGAGAEISSAIIFSSNYSFLSSELSIPIPELFSYYSPLSISAAIKFTQIFGSSILYFVYNWSTFFIRFIVFIVLLIIGILSFIHSIKHFSKKSNQFKQFLILNSNDDEEYNGF